MNKKIFAICAAIVCIAAFTACERSESVQPEESSGPYVISGERITDNIKDEEDKGSLCEYSCTKLSSEDETDAVKKVIEEYNQKALDEVSESAKEYADLKKEYGADTDTPFAADKSVSVTRSDKLVFSFIEKNYSYAGGAHPNTYYVAMNYDAQTGKQLALSDAVSNEEAFLDETVDRIYKKYSKDMFQSRDELRESLNAETLVFSLGYDGITVIFNPYEIASYAAGTLVVTIPYEDESRFSEIPDEYVIPMDNFESIRYEGSRLSVEQDYSYNPDGEGAISKIRVRYGKNEAECDASYFYATPYFVKLKNKEEVYIPCRLGDGSYLAEVFEIKEGTVSYDKRIEGISYGGVFTETAHN